MSFHQLKELPLKDLRGEGGLFLLLFLMILQHQRQCRRRTCYRSRSGNHCKKGGRPGPPFYDVSGGYVGLPPIQDCCLLFFISSFGCCCCTTLSGTTPFCCERSLESSFGTDMPILGHNL